MNMGAKMTGSRELKRKLRRLGDEADEIALTGLLAGGEVIREAAVEEAPFESGTLRRSIHVEPE